MDPRNAAAAPASLHAGAFDAALWLLAAAEAGSLDEFQRDRAELLRAQVAFASSVGGDAPASTRRGGGRERPARRGRRARTGRPQVLVLGLPPLEDAAATG
jgi:hypothetical protein